MAINRAAEMIDELEAARPTMSVGEYEMHRRQLDNLIKRGYTYDLTPIERGVSILLWVAMVAIPLLSIWAIYAAGGHLRWGMAIFLALIALATGLTAHSVGRRGFSA